ncbi:MAG: aldo/keto reductase [Candidatus Cyclobacteriaceae bacterium M2_1C_046]
MATNTNTSISQTFAIGGDLTVNRMGYGAMRITGEGIWGPPEDKEEAIRVLKRTVELGINFIDTADSYGPDVSEELIAEALHPYPDDLIIATKGGFERTGPGEWHVNCVPDRLQEALEGSLKRLKLNQIKLYQLHRIDEDVPFEKQFKFLQRIQNEGLVKHIGLSEVSVDQIKRAQEYVNVVSVQNKYSIDYRDWEKELEYCNQNDIAFIPWNPINAGNLQIEGKLEEIGRRHNATGQQIALSWLLHHSPNILLIPGTSKVEHLEENVEAAAIDLAKKDLQELEEISSQ